MKTPALIASLVLAQAFCHVHAATTLFDFSFDGNTGNDVGSVIGVYGVALGTADTSTGVATTNNTNNSAMGFAGSAAVNTSTYNGFTVTYYVDGTYNSVSTLINNGLFFGIVRSASAPTTTTLFSNSGVASFGYAVASNSYDNRVYSKTGAGTVTSVTASTPTPDNASYADGFTFSFTVLNDNTWSITSTGLSTELNASGALSDFSLNYSNFANIYAMSSIQQGTTAGGTRSYDLSRVTIVGIPEPSHAALIGLAGLCFLVRRRR